MDTRPTKIKSLKNYYPYGISSHVIIRTIIIIKLVLTQYIVLILICAHIDYLFLVISVSELSCILYNI